LITRAAGKGGKSGGPRVTCSQIVGERGARHRRTGWRSTLTLRRREQDVEGKEEERSRKMTPNMPRNIRLREKEMESAMQRRSKIIHAHLHADSKRGKGGGKGGKKGKLHRESCASKRSERKKRRGKGREEGRGVADLSAFARSIAASQKEEKRGEGKENGGRRRRYRFLNDEEEIEKEGRDRKVILVADLSASPMTFRHELGRRKKKGEEERNGQSLRLRFRASVLETERGKRKRRATFKAGYVITISLSVGHDRREGRGEKKKGGRRKERDVWFYHRHPPAPETRGKREKKERGEIRSHLEFSLSYSHCGQGRGNEAETTPR